MRFPVLGTSILRHLGSQVYKRKQQTAKELQANGIRVIKEKEEANEVLIVWSQRGQVDILREHERHHLVGGARYCVIAKVYGIAGHTAVL